MTKVLLVEDDPLIYRMYQRALKRHEYDTAIAENGQEGLEKVASFQPDIILLDIMMPGMNGVEMLGHLKDDPATASIPVIVLTNVSELPIANEVVTRGANLSLLKSETEPDQVIGWIESVLAKPDTTAKQ